MSQEHTSVAIVMRADFGAELPSLTDRFHVWLVDTPVNRRAAELVWAASPGDRTHGVTTFRRHEGESTDSAVVDLLPVIDEHHGLREDWATDIVLDVLGVPLTSNIRSALAALGPFDVLERSDGFTATRSAGIAKPDVP